MKTEDEIKTAFYENLEILNPVERLKQVTTVLDRHKLANYISDLEDYLLDQDGFGRCDCCKHVVYRDFITNLTDNFNNHLDIFVCEDCKKEIE